VGVGGDSMVGDSMGGAGDSRDWIDGLFPAPPSLQEASVQSHSLPVVGRELVVTVCTLCPGYQQV
jgi:hypothetical protein